MKKNAGVVALVLLLLATGPAFADTGIGAAFGYGGRGGDLAVALSLDLDPIPGDVMTLSFHLGDSFALSVMNDWYLIDTSIADSIVGFYLGPGLYLDFGIASDQFLFSFGGRFPIGLDLTLLGGTLYFFLEAAPFLGVTVAPEVDFPQWDVNGSFGFRIYF